jgi:hypothetical protein
MIVLISVYKFLYNNFQIPSLAIIVTQHTTLNLEAWIFDCLRGNETCLCIELTVTNNDLFQSVILLVFCDCLTCINSLDFRSIVRCCADHHGFLLTALTPKLSKLPILNWVLFSAILSLSLTRNSVYCRRQGPACKQLLRTPEVGSIMNASEHAW